MAVTARADLVMNILKLVASEVNLELMLVMMKLIAHSEKIF
jgi:hypothetical protein